MRELKLSKKLYLKALSLHFTALYPGLPSQLFSQPWKNAGVFPQLRKSCEERPGYEANKPLVSLGPRQLSHLSPVDEQDSLVLLRRGAVLGNGVQVEGTRGAEGGKDGR